MIRSNSSSTQKMLGCKMLHVLTPWIVVFLLLCFSLGSPLYAGTIIPGTPTKNGTDTFTLTLKNGTVKTVPVTVTKGMAKEDKADAIQTAVNNAGLVASVTAAGNVDVASTKSISSTSTSGETDTFALLLLPNGPAFAQVDLHLGPTFADLTGIDSNGDPASYTAGFNFASPSVGDISLLTSLGFADLATPTLDGLLQQEFDLLLGQLQIQAPSLVSDLSLNVAEGAIVFQPSGLFTSASATNGTTDVGLESTLGVSTAVPEPPSLLMMGSGLSMLLGLVCFARRRSRVPNFT